MSKGNMTELLTALDKTPMRYGEMQAHLFCGDHTKTQGVPRGWNCDALAVVIGKKYVVKKGKMYKLTALGRKNMLTPYATTKAEWKLYYERASKRSVDLYDDNARLKFRLTDALQEREDLRSENDSMRDILIRLSKAEFSRVLASNQFDSELLSYLLTEEK